MAIVSPSRRTVSVAGSPSSAGVEDAGDDRLVLADDAEARRLDELDAAIALALVAGDRAHAAARRSRARRRSGNVVGEPVGDDDRAADALGRRVAERRAQRREQLRAAIVGIAARRLDERISTLSSAASRFVEFDARRRRLARPLADLVGCRLIEHQRDDVLQRPTVLAHQRRIGERQPAAARRRARAPPAARGAATRSARPAPAPRRRARQRPEAAAAARRRSTTRSMRKPFQQVLGVDLVGLVAAGQRVHHQVDAAAQRHLALARPAGRERIERPAVGVGRPGGGEIVGGDDDRRDAVAGARRTRRAIVGVGRRQRLDPGQAASVRPTKRSMR